jgi:hypothetical protein
MSVIKALFEDLEDQKSEQDVAVLIKEWVELSKQAEIIKAVGNRLGSRLSVIEENLIPLIKDFDDQQASIDGSIAKYKQKKSTSVSYKDAVAKAMEICNKTQKAALENFIKEITKTSSSDAIDIKDPELSKLVQQLKADMDSTQLLKLARKIKALPELPLKEASIKDMIMNAFKRITVAVGSIVRSLTKAASGLEKAVNSQI